MKKIVENLDDTSIEDYLELFMKAIGTKPVISMSFRIPILINGGIYITEIKLEERT